MLVRSAKTPEFQYQIQIADDGEPRSDRLTVFVSVGAVPEQPPRAAEPSEIVLVTKRKQFSDE